MSGTRLGPAETKRRARVSTAPLRSRVRRTKDQRNAPKQGCQTTQLLCTTNTFVPSLSRARLSGSRLSASCIPPSIERGGRSSPENVLTARATETERERVGSLALTRCTFLPACVGIANNRLCRVAIPQKTENSPFFPPHQG